MRSPQLLVFEEDREALCLGCRGGSSGYAGTTYWPNEAVLAMLGYLRICRDDAIDGPRGGTSMKGGGGYNEGPTEISGTKWEPTSWAMSANMVSRQSGEETTSKLLRGAVTGPGAARGCFPFPVRAEFSVVVDGGSGFVVVAGSPCALSDSWESAAAFLAAIDMDVFKCERTCHQ